MPLFEYECKDCGEVTDRLRLPGDPVESWEMCPVCGGRQDRVMARSNFKINGFSEANGYAKKGDE